MAVPEKELARIISLFTKQFQIIAEEQDNNNIFSPISMHAFFTLLSQDSWFRNQNFLIECVNAKIATHYKYIFSTLNLVCGLLYENIYFLSDSGKVQNIFKERLKDNYATEVNSFDFTKSEEIGHAVNAWIGNKINQRVNYFSGFTEDTILTILNAMQFESTWAESFTEQDIVPDKFYLNKQDTLEVQMMKTTGEFYYKNCIDLCSKILKLPLTSSNMNLIIILPNEEISFMDWEKKFNCCDLKQLSMDAIKQEISICLPKLKIEGSVDLAHFIKTMKIEDIFTVKLVGIVEDEELSFKNIQQKVYLDINEKGLEFSAGTASSLTKALEEEVSPENGLIIYEANMYTDISNHFAKTNVVWKVKNSNKTVSNAKFRVILTDTAFITEFAMEIDGSCYKSHIKGKKVKNVHSVTCTGWQLKPAYVTTQIRSASITEAKTRDCIEFTVTENLQPDSVATFSLTYEEMLQRFDDQYELVLNISPGQIVDSLTIKVNINESQPIRFVKTPPLRSGIDLTASECDKYLDPLSDINMINSKTASIKFHPDPVRQKKMAHYLGKKTSEGLAGQFVVQYDIERDSLNGEVLLQDEYFVHSFAPDDFYSIHKHVIFLLDTSGSMMGSNIEYLKDAVMNILSDLRREDMLSILEFNSQVIVWDIASKMSTSFYEEKIMNFREPFTSLQKCILADPQYASDSIIKNAKEIIQGIRPDGGTFMIGGLESALYLAKMGQLKHTDKNEKLQSVIVFLTDGDPNIGIGPPEEIIELVTHLNKEDKVAIFSLSFGNANSDFLRKLSLRNFGFSRNVYNAPDVSLQLQKNYKQISSLLLHNIKFSYGTEVEDVTKTWFPNYFGGSELVVAGRHTGPSFSGTIDCCGFHGPVTITSTTRTAMSLERLWAFLTMKHLLDERDRGTDSRNITRNAVNLAIKYSYLTDVTSLVIEKPNNTITIVDNQFMNMGPGRYHKNSISQNDHYRLKRKRDSYDDWAKRKMVFRKYCRSSKEYYLGGPSSNTQLCARSDGSKLFSHNEGPTVNKGSTSDNEKKPAEKFIANRPFFVLLELEKDDTNLILFMGHIYKPM